MNKMTKKESTRPWKSLHHRATGRETYGQLYDLAAALIDGPKTFDQIAEHYKSYLRLIGIYAPLDPVRLDENEFSKEILASLDQLVERGWVEKNGDTWLLTEKGKIESEKSIRDVARSKKYIEKILQPETVSKVSVCVHLLLASIKLPAAILSGSVGLLNDSIDTLLDGLSSIFVYFGLKYNKEKIVNIFLTFLMVVVASVAMKESILRFFRPYTPQVDLFTFGATIISAIFCGVLYLYQGYVGSKTGSISLITQSVDSRNHVIIAISVTAGLIGTITGHVFIDTIVGFGVALLLLQSTIELIKDLLRNFDDAETSTSSFNIPFNEKFIQFRREKLGDYLLYQVNENEYSSLGELKQIGLNAYDFSSNTMIRELGVSTHPLNENDIDDVIYQLINDKLITTEPIVNLTDKGVHQLKLRLRKSKNAIL